MKVFATILYHLALATASNLQLRQAPSSTGATGSGLSGRLKGTGLDGIGLSLVDDLFYSAGLEPSATSAVTFDLSSGPIQYGQSGWTWRINITDLAVPESVFPGNLQVLNMQWELEWPGGGTFGALLTESTEMENVTEPCFRSVKYRLPSNITSRYSESDNGNCSTVLGDACAQRLLSNLTNVCGNSFLVGPSNWEECADTLGVASPESYFENLNSSSSLRSGETFFYDTSPALPAAAVSQRYEEAGSDLNILFLEGFPGTNGMGDAVLCQVVNTSNAASMRGNLLWMLSLAVGCVFVFM